MKNLQSQLRPPCPWVPQIWLVTELCLNFLINSVNKAEIDDLAAFFFFPKAGREQQPQDQQEFSRGLLSEAAKCIFLSHSSGWAEGPSDTLCCVCRSHHLKHSPYFHLLRHFQVREGGTCTDFSRFCSKRGEYKHYHLVLSPNKENRCTSLLGSISVLQYTERTPRGEKSSSEKDNCCRNSAKIIPTNPSSNQSVEGCGDPSRAWSGARVVLKDSTKSGSRESSLLLLLLASLQELRAIWGDFVLIKIFSYF